MAKMATGGMARLEGGGVLFLRSLCNLMHVGHAQYYKGGGHEFQDYLETNYPGLAQTLTLNCTYHLLNQFIAQIAS